MSADLYKILCVCVCVWQCELCAAGLTVVCLASPHFNKHPFMNLQSCRKASIMITGM